MNGSRVGGLVSSFLPFSERNVILTGAIGAEHTRIGRRLAESLSMPFVSVEQLIAERLEMTIDEIRAYYGETRLKAIEAEIVEETALRRSTVIRVSGRTLINGDNYAQLAATGMVFCLIVDLDAMLQRLHISMGARYHDPKDRALALGELERERMVHRLDDLYRINVTRMTADEIVDTLATTWRSLIVRADAAITANGDGG